MVYRPISIPYRAVFIDRLCNPALGLLLLYLEKRIFLSLNLESFCLLNDDGIKFAGTGLEATLWLLKTPAS